MVYKVAMGVLVNEELRVPVLADALHPPRPSCVRVDHSQNKFALHMSRCFRISQLGDLCQDTCLAWFAMSYGFADGTQGHIHAGHLLHCPTLCNTLLKERYDSL